MSALVVSMLLTCIPYYLGIGKDPATHFGAVFASWVGGVALFVVAGVVVAVVSLVKPEQESFDARARILFRRQSGKHVDYIVSRISHSLEQYAESTECLFSITGYDPAEKKYRLSYKSTIVVRSYIEDIRTSYNSYVSYSGVTTPPPNGDPNTLLYVRVDNTAIGGREDFETEVRREVNTTIDPDGACRIEHRVEFWALADQEPNSHAPRRYTQSLKLQVENICGLPGPVKIKFTQNGGNTWNFIDLAQGELKDVLEARDLLPKAEVFDFRVLAP